MRLLKSIERLLIAGIMTSSLLLSAFSVSADNTIQTADKIEFNTEYGIEYEKTSDYQANHFVKFTTPSNGIVTVNCDKPVINDENGNMSFTFYNSKSDEIAKYINPVNDNNSIVFNIALKAGTYYLNIQNDFPPAQLENDETVDASFTLAFTKKDYCEFEPNNTRMMATPIMFDKTYSAYIEPGNTAYDYYAITVNASTKVRINIGNYKALISNDVGGDVSFKKLTDKVASALTSYAGDTYGTQSYNFNSANTSMKANGNTYYIDKQLDKGTYYLIIENSSTCTNNLAYSVTANALKTTVNKTDSKTSSVKATKASGTKQITAIQTKPAKVTKLKLKTKGKKKIVVSWKSVKGAKGYQIQMSKSKTFKYKVVNSKIKTTKVIIKKLKSKKTYWVRVRAYNKRVNVNKVTHPNYGPWIIKKIKVK